MDETLGGEAQWVVEWPQAEYWCCKWKKIMVAAENLDGQAPSHSFCK